MVTRSVFVPWAAGSPPLPYGDQPLLLGT